MLHLTFLIVVLNLFVYLSSENVPPMEGFYTDCLDKNLNKVEIVYPERVSKDGSFVSYYLPHYYNLDSVENRPRRTSGQPTRSSEDAIHFFVPIKGEKHHLELWPNLNFIAPSLVIEKRDARDVENINKAKISQISQRQCHYNGQIVGKPNTKAALSTCYGLAGYIRVPAGDEYIIEPVKDYKPVHDKEHPHIMYKRSGIKDRHGGSNCLTKGRAKEALAERMKWEALFGDEVRKEFSGININQLVQEGLVNNRAPSHTSFLEKLPVEKVPSEIPTRGDFPAIGKSSFLDENTPFEDLTKRTNVPQGVAKTQYGIGVQEEPHSENALNNGLSQFDAQVRNGKLYLGNKLKHKTLKEELNMGNIKMSDADLKSRMEDQGVDLAHSPESTKYESEKQVGDNIPQKRFKRDLDNNDFKPDSNKNTEKDQNNDKNVDDGSLNREKNVAGVESSEQDATPLSVNEENNEISDLKYTLETVHLGENKRETKINQRQQLPVKEKSVSNLKNVCCMKGKLGAEKQKINKKIKTKRECDQTKQASLRLHENDANNDVGNQENNKQGKDVNIVNKPNSEDLSFAQKKVEEKKNDEVNFIGGDDKNMKRDIHLDSSDKSWQTNEKDEKSKSKLDKDQNNSVNEDTSDKLSEESSEPNMSKNLLNSNDKSKELESSKITKVDKESMDTDEKIMTSVIESVVKNVDKSKIKNEIDNGVDSEKSGNINKREQQIYSKNPLHEEPADNKYIKFDQICLTNTKDAQGPEVAETAGNNQIVFSNKEPSGEENQRSGPESRAQFGQEQANQNDVNEIVIRIKAPEGSSISDIKQQPEVEVDNTKKEHYGGVKTADLKDSILDSEIGSAKMSFRTAVSDKNKRFVADQPINSIPQKKNDDGKNQQPLKNEASSESGRFSLVIERENGASDSGSKSKRDGNTIQLIIRAEPEETERSSLFCQGKNCLDIKPVLLNDTNPAAASPTNSNNNSHVENVKTKLVEKRQVPQQDDCTTEPPTEVNLVCFDFFNRQYHMEVMITVDFKVVKMHESDDMENFILTIMNMVSTNFNDKTVGLNMNVVLVRLIMLTTCIKELDSDRFNPDELLENFCTWQVLINPGKDEHPHHHDIAIFLTRMEKCEGRVMGVTYMTSVCRPDKACLVCVDEGLLLANTITHQIGHSLGAEHDDSESNGCAATSPEGTSFHMAPVISETNSGWSACSRDFIIQFVRTQGSWCLTDVPIEWSFNFPLILPGQIYSAAQQCKLNFHMNTLPCAIGAFCNKLYCQVTDKLCATKGDPPADGTFCASNMWCFHKKCVHIGRRPGAVNGEWGPWTEWSICTRSCGGGVASSFRICNNPKPENGGRYCIGDRIRHRMCATKACQGLTESFRDLQCKKTEDRPFRGRLHNWVQYNSFFLNIECSLVCQNRKGQVVMRSPIVADGTPCKAGTRNVCIQGICRNVGCDWVIDSNAKEDSCGICHGNSTECKIIQGVFDEPSTKRGLVEFLRIPKDAGMVFVREISPSVNVLVVSGAINRVYYLNGAGTEDSMPGDVSFGLTHGVYEVRCNMERIFIRGPTTEDLIFYVLFREANKGIHYQYAVPETDPTYVPHYLWQFLDWDVCTDPCSGGSQRARPKCVEDRGGVVDDQFCTESSKPLDIIRPCNTFPCQARWWVSVWSDCICTGDTSVMFRSVLCMRPNDESGTRSEVVKESECAGHKKPTTQKPCNATDEDEPDCVKKRSLIGDNVFRSHKDIRRAVSPKTVFAAFSEGDIVDTGSQDSELLPSLHPASEKEDRESEKTTSNKNQKKSVKPQNNKNVNLKGAVNKLKSKLVDKETVQQDKKKIAPLKAKEASNFKPAAVTKNDRSEESKAEAKAEEVPLVPGKGKQTIKLNSDSGPAVGVETDKGVDVKQTDKSKQTEKPQPDPEGSNSDDAQVTAQEDNPSTNISMTCPTAPPETTEGTTCKQTCNIQPHRKTTCCRTPAIKEIFLTQVSEKTTLRPIVVHMDELNMDNFALTVIPIDTAIRKKMPQSDPEYVNLGNIGQYGVADEANGTVISGQEALDFLEFARSNASEEPVILHEGVHN